MPIDPKLLESFSLLGVGLVFLGGLLTSLGPCNMATIPLIVGYVGGSHNLSRGRSFALSLVFATGLAITFMALGVFAALVGGLIGASTSWWYYLVAGVCFIIGLNMLGVLKFNLPMLFGGLREKIGLKVCRAPWF
jgi:cytochrome c-type biogenesis protein